MSLENIMRRLEEAGEDVSMEGLIANERAQSKTGEPGPFETRYRAYQKSLKEHLDARKAAQKGSSQQ